MPDGTPTGGGPGSGVRRRWRSRRVVVRDDSMRPEFEPGDHLYVDPRSGRSLERGDVVAARDPERPDRLLLKRVAALAGEPRPDGGVVPPGSVYLLGDRADASRDSRSFGPVPLAALVGVVWFRYAPAARRGPAPVDTFK